MSPRDSAKQPSSLPAAGYSHVQPPCFFESVAGGGDPGSVLRNGTEGGSVMTTVIRRAFYAWAAFMVLAGAVYAQDRQDWIKRVASLEPDGIVWANPAVGKPLRVLFVAHVNAVGEAACVARRLTMEWDVVGWPSPWSKPGPAAVETLRKALEKDWDVLVVGGPYSVNSSFPPAIRYEIYRKLIAGMGLVSAPPFPQDILDKAKPRRGVEAFTGVPFDIFESIVAEKNPTNAPPDRLDEFGRFVPRGYTRANHKMGFEKGVEAREIGKCRIAKLPFAGAGWGVHASFVSAPFGDYTPDMFIGDEYYLSLLCKAIRSGTSWAHRATASAPS